jgi:hypothetical protein
MSGQRRRGKYRALAAGTEITAVHRATPGHDDELAAVILRRKD